MYKTLPKNVISFFPHFPHFEIFSQLAVFKLEYPDGMSIKSLQAFPFCEMASFLFLGKGGAQPVVWSTLVHCPTVALKTN